MSIELYDPFEIIDVAIGREEMSVRIYADAQKIVKDAKSRQVLSRMQNEEMRHKKLLVQVKSSKDFGKLGKPAVSGKLPKVNVAKEKTLRKDATIKDILLFAIGHEERAIDYYSRYLDVFRGTSIGELFGRLKSEEEQHREQLELMLSKL